MKIKYSKVFVNDQDKALKFYTETLGFVKKGDVRAEGYRWLTVVSPENKNGTELILEKNDNPAAKAFQKAMFEQGLPAANFVVKDVRAEYARLAGLGVKFTVEPTDYGDIQATVAVFDDTAGNLIQIQKTA